MTVLGQARDALHLRFVQDQQHKGLVRNGPFACDAVSARGFEAEARVEVCVAEDDDERVSRVFELLVAGLD